MRALGTGFVASLLVALLAACGGSSDAGGGSGADGVGADIALVSDGVAAVDTARDTTAPSPDVSEADDAGPAGGDGATLDGAPGPDVSVTSDTGGPRPPCEPCGTADVRGRVCAPNEQVHVSGAMVWVDTIGCDGAPARIEALSDARGYYLLEGVPCGEQTIHIERGSFEHDFQLVVRPGELNDITGADYKLCFSSRAARIAVITGDWDDIENLVHQMGFDADVFELYAWEDPDSYGGDVFGGPAYQLLHDITELQQYDILLIDCGAGHYDMAEAEVDFNIRQYVEGGGSLYMSDFAYIYSERVWPGAIDFWGNNETAGTMGASDGPIVLHSADLTGIVLDPDLKAYLGGPASIPINLGLSPLVSVEGAPATTTMHVIAQIPQFNNTNQPLILSYRPTETSGFVIYTTFHNTEQHMEQMQKVLQYLMFVL